MCAYRDDYSDFEAKGARVFSISHDSRWTLKAWKDAMGFKHTLLSDTKGEVAKLYGCWNEELGLAERLTVVVDKDGVIRYVTRSEISQPRDHREALAAIWQTTTSTPGEGYGRRRTPHYCFGCSERNPIGLHLSFTMADGEVRAPFTPQAEHQGWPGFMHGGLVATMLDEAMGWVIDESWHLGRHRQDKRSLP